MTGADVAVESEGGSRRFTITGEIDLGNAADIEAAIVDGISNQVSDVLVDLSGVEYIDSSGMRILFALAGKLKTLQVRLVVAAPVGSPARRVVELSGMAAVVELEPKTA